MFTHNAFRFPGAASLEELRAAPKKVHYLQTKYNAMHRHVYAHVYAHDSNVDETNIDELRDAIFVFVCVDHGPSKKFVLRKLEEFGVPFVDTGMGVWQTGDAVGGIDRTSIGLPGRTQRLWSELSFADNEDDEYDQDIQIAKLNMLNAAHAVIVWKKTFGFYFDFEHESMSTYTVDGNHLLNERHAS